MKATTKTHEGTRRETRVKAIAKIQILWKQRRPDLWDADESRRARLEFCGEALGLKAPPATLADLSDEQLGRVIEALKAVDSGQRAVDSGLRVVGSDKPAMQRVARKDACAPRVASGGEVVHLAGTEQVWAIERVSEYLEWPPTKREEYTKKRFGRASARMLTSRQAWALMMQLLTIAASSDLKRERGREATISREEIRRYIPELKEKLGIGGK